MRARCIRSATFRRWCAAIRARKPAIHGRPAISSLSLELTLMLRAASTRAQRLLSLRRFADGRGRYPICESRHPLAHPSVGRGRVRLWPEHRPFAGPESFGRSAARHPRLS